MDKLIPMDILKFKLIGEGTGTGYILYIDDFTHDILIDIYEKGERIKQYRVKDDDELKEILERVKND